MGREVLAERGSSLHGAVSGKRGKERDESTVCGV
jgi:hypothetical protein